MRAAVFAGRRSQVGSVGDPPVRPVAENGSDADNKGQ